MIHGKLKEAFLQGEEREAANLFRELLRRSVRAGLFEAMAEEVEALCGPRYHPEDQSLCHRAGSETGIAYLDGGKEKIRRPRAGCATKPMAKSGLRHIRMLDPLLGVCQRESN